MSKSLGNFYTMRDLLDKGYSGREVRYLLISTHYRHTLNFTFKGLDAARAALSRLDEFRQRLVDRAGDVEAGEAPDWAIERRASFQKHLDEDLNIAGGLAALFDLVSSGNRALDAGEVAADEAAAVLHVILRQMDEVLAFLEPEEQEAGPAVEELVRQRTEARANKDWSEADRIRDELAELGWEVKDTPQGPRLKKI